MNLSGVGIQLAVQKYMTLKMKAANSTTLGPNAADLS